MENVKIYVLTAEYYRNDDDIVAVQGIDSHIVDGIVIAKIPIAIIEETDEVHEALKNLAKRILTGFISEPEFIKKTYPKFYNISLTKPFWFHFMEERSMKEIKKSLEETTLEDNLSEPTIDEDSDSSDLLNNFEVLFDKDINEILSQPDPINFWDTL